MMGERGVGRLMPTLRLSDEDDQELALLREFLLSL
jgi:hypothetical protein